MSSLVVCAVPGRRPWTAGRRIVRLLAIAAAVACALAIWVIAESVFGIDLRAPAFGGSAETLPVQAHDVLLVSGLLSFAGWGCMAVLERLTPKARQLWLVLSVTALVLSLATPFAGSGVSLANRIVLMLMHVAVGSVIISLLYRTSRR